MCSVRCLQVLICVTAVLSSSNGFPDSKDRLSMDDSLKKSEMDYGERLSSMEDDSMLLRGELNRGQELKKSKLGSDKGPERVHRLIGKARPVPKHLDQENTPSTKCSTSQPISVDFNNLQKDSDEDSTSIRTITITMSSSIAPIVTPTKIKVPSGNDRNKDGADRNKIDSDENEVQSDVGAGLNEDPAKDDDDDAALSTKKYFGPKASYVPDHYLDDARK